MLTGTEFAENALNLLGEPYNNVDCIGVVRLAAHIKCSGTNWLWRSYKNSPKYKYLKERADCAPELSQLQDGLLVFRIKWTQVPDGYTDRPNCHHVGVIYGQDVIQSNSGRGVYRSAYKSSEWNGCGELKGIDYSCPFLTKVQDITEPELSDHEMIKALYNYFIGQGQND